MDSFHLLVGSQNGYLKGVSLTNGDWSNIASSEKNNDIVSMCWNDQNEERVCIGTVKQEVKIFDSTGFYVTHDLSGGDEGQLVGLCKFNNNLVTCTNGGLVRVWSEDFEAEPLMKKEVGLKVNFMKQNFESTNLVATGGEENELKIWDLNNSAANVFTAKNVKNDWLNLRVPVWVLNAAFVPGSQKIFTSTSHHQVRLYDPKCQKRPVMEVKFEECPLSCISVANDNMQVVVGSSQGHLGLLDFRGKSGYIVHKFKGPTGAIRSVECIPSKNVFVCCGYDRFLRVYDITDRSLVHKSFLKAKLNCLLLKSNINDVEFKESTKEVSKPVTSKDADDEKDESDSEIWSQMKVVEDESKVSKRKTKDDTETKPNKRKC